MKFYKDKYGLFYWYKILYRKLTAIYYNDKIVFYKNGKFNNNKNVAYIDDRIKSFCLDGKVYGTENDFNKKSWRKFVKLQAFL